MSKWKHARTKRVSRFKLFFIISLFFTIFSIVAPIFFQCFPTVPKKVPVISEEHPKVKQYFYYIYFETAPINAGEYVNGTITFYNIDVEKRFLPMFYIIAEGKLSTVNGQNPTPINPDYSSEGKPYIYSSKSKTFEINFSFKANSSTIYLFLIPQQFSNFKVNAYVVRNMPNQVATYISLSVTIGLPIYSLLKKYIKKYKKTFKISLKF
jgi:hypothetical protein